MYIHENRFLDVAQQISMGKLSELRSHCIGLGFGVFRGLGKVSISELKMFLCIPVFANSGFFLRVVLIEFPPSPNFPKPTQNQSLHFSALCKLP